MEYVRPSVRPVHNTLVLFYWRAADGGCFAVECFRCLPLISTNRIGSVKKVTGHGRSRKSNLYQTSACRTRRYCFVWSPPNDPRRCNARAPDVPRYSAAGRTGIGCLGECGCVPPADRSCPVLNPCACACCVSGEGRGCLVLLNELEGTHWTGRSGSCVTFACAGARKVKVKVKCSGALPNSSVAVIPTCPSQHPGSRGHRHPSA